jgi:L-fuconolactonase
MSQQPPAHRIDSHHHIWDTAAREYPWMTGLDAIMRPFGVDDLRPLLEANGIDGTVLVQTVSDLDETRELLAIAAETDFIAGVVGWADLQKLDLAADLDALRAGEGGDRLVGIRHQVHDEEDPDWLLHEEVQRGLEVLADNHLVYDVLVRPRELPAAITVARDFPHLRFVVDHIAKPPIATGELEPWASLMGEFAGLEHVACKLSGMVTEADPETWQPADLLPYVRTAVEIFGPDRLMWGSDWPVCLLAADYARVLDATREVLEELDVLSDAADRAIFGETAIRWYNLDTSRLTASG